MRANHMKFNTLLHMLILPVVFFSIQGQAMAQGTTAASSRYKVQIDSIAKAYHQQEAVEAEQKKKSENLSDLKSDKKATRDAAREAQRIRNDANDAARESKIAYRQEKKAQRAREQADKQAEKASKARTKSDNN